MFSKYFYGSLNLNLQFFQFIGFTRKQKPKKIETISRKKKTKQIFGFNLYQKYIKNCYNIAFTLIMSSLQYQDLIISLSFISIFLTY
jgi:hypothetical protein